MKKSEFFKNIYDVDRTISEIKSEIKAACNDKDISELDKNRFSKHIEKVVNFWAEIKILADAFIDGESDWETAHELYVKGRLEVLNILKEIVLRPNLFDRSNPGLNGFQDTEKSVVCHKEVTGNGSDQMDLNSSISFMDLMLAR